MRSLRFCAALGLVLTFSTCRLQTPNEIVKRPARTIPDAGEEQPLGDGGVGPGPTIPFTKADLLKEIADCAMGRYAELEPAVVTLQTATRAWANDRSDANRTAARDAWIAAMSVLELVEGFRFGPAARSPEPGAADLRDQIYAWPLLNTCKMDELIVDKGYVGTGVASMLINTRGLGAVEYLLFRTSTGNTCSEFSKINSQGTWAALDASELALRRAEYAAAVVDDVVTRVHSLRQAWAPDAGNFRQQFVTAGSGSTVYPTDQDALNAASHALFYLDHEVKDLKLGRPIGLDCPTATCPDALESQYARISTAHLRANLAAFRRLFVGCSLTGESLGFDDWLWAAGSGELAVRMTNALDAVEAKAAALDPPIEQALVTDLPQVEDLYAAVKRLTDLLKVDFITVLNLELPKTVEGDND